MSQIKPKRGLLKHLKTEGEKLKNDSSIFWQEPKYSDILWYSVQDVNKAKPGLVHEDEIDKMVKDWFRFVSRLRVHKIAYNRRDLGKRLNILKKDLHKCESTEDLDQMIEKVYSEWKILMAEQDKKFEKSIYAQLEDAQNQLINKF